MRVLLVEDDQYLLDALRLALKHKGYNVDSVKNGIEADAAMMTVPYDLVLLDLGLPGRDGTAVLEDLRAKGQCMPVIIITARDGIDDRINGLDLGANDYLVKPFDIRELEARIRAVLRKSHWSNKLDIELGSLVLNTNSGEITCKKGRLNLTPKEAAILKLLMSKGGQVVSKRQLVEHLSDWVEEASENAIEILVHRLRKKLEQADVSITTIRGFGYKLEQII